MKPSLRKSLFTSILALSLISIACISGAFVFMEYYDFKQEESLLRDEYINTQKKILRSEVDRAVDYVFYMKWRTDRRLRNSIKNRVIEAYSVASNLYETYKDTKPKAEIAELIKAALRDIRFSNGRGYYFVFGLDGTLILQPANPDLEGKDFSHREDEAGFNFAQTAIDIAEGQGQGFFSYRWLKPGVKDKQFKKMSYVKLFQPLGWCIGTGEYVDDVKKDIQDEVLTRLEKVRFGDGGYIFVGQWDGLSLAGPAQGKNMLDVEDMNGIKIVQKLIETSQQGGGYVNYILPEFNNKPSVSKISYTRGVDDWQWYVGAGIRLNEIDSRLAGMRKELYARLYQHTLLFIAFFLILAGCVFLYSDRLARRLANTANDFMVFFEKARTEFASIEPNAQFYQEFSDIAQAANEMIASRQQIEVNLGWSEKRFKLLFNAIKDAILVYRIESDGSRGTFIEFNDAACEQLSYTCEELEGMTMDAIDMGGGPSIEKRINRDGFAVFETTFRTKSVRLIPVEVHARLFELGGQASILLISRDITSRRQSKADLKVSLEKYRALFEIFPFGITITDEEGNIIEVNQESERLLGVSSSNHEGRNLDSEEWVIVDPDGMAMDHKDYPASIALRENTIVRNQEIGVVKGHDKTAWISVTAAPIPLDGYGVVAGYIDVSSRRKIEKNLKESEAQFRRLVEDLGDRFFLFRHDLEGVLSYVSPSAENMLGIDVDKAVGSDWRKVLSWDAEAVATAEENILLLAEEHAETVTYELTHTDQNGQRSIIEVTEHLVVDKDDIPVGLEGIVVDITERAQLEEELREYGDKLEEMVRERTEKLTATVAELRKRSDESSAMARFGDLLQVCETDQESYGIIASICTNLFDGHSGYLALVDEHTKSLVAVSGFGEFQWEDVEFDMHDCWALRRGRPHVISDPALDPPCQHMHEALPGASICMPVEARGEYLGLLHIQLSLSDGLSPQQRSDRLAAERDLARRVTELYSLSLANIRLRETLRAQSIRDPLTGLFNRRHMEASLAREIDRARRKSTSLGVILMDVDHFKQFNDTHGHEAGDVVLRKLGDYLLEHTRGEDIPCRYGGEELLLILPDCSSSDCLKRAEQVRQGVENLRISHDSNRLKVTVSLGTAVYPDHGKTSDDLVGAADQGLYRAKEKGRNRVETI